MNVREAEAVLAQTFADRRVTRNERSALADAFAELPRADDFNLVLSRAFAMARDALASPDDKQVLEWVEDVVKAARKEANPVGQSVESEAYFSPGDECPRRIIGLLNAARRTIDLCVFTITDDRLTSAILDAHRRRVAVRILTDNDKAQDLGSDIERLATAGIPVRVDRTEYHMHHKFALFDGARLLTGSYNWTRGASSHNEENFIVTNDRGLIAAFSRAFEGLWTGLEP